MMSEQAISDEIRDIFDVLWEKVPQSLTNPKIKPINNFLNTFKACQELPDPRAFNSRKMVGWKVATFEKNDPRRSPLQVEVIPFRSREFVSATLIAANLLNFGSNCAMFGNPKREMDPNDLYDFMMDWLVNHMVQPMGNNWKTIT